PPRTAGEDEGLGDAPCAGALQTARPVHVAGECIVRSWGESIGDAPGGAAVRAPGRVDEGRADGWSGAAIHRDDPSPPVSHAVDPPPRDAVRFEHGDDQLEVVVVDLTVHPGRDLPPVHILRGDDLL